MGCADSAAPHSKYIHVFAILRVDDFGDLDVDIEQRITVTKVVGSAEEAAGEVERLNSLRDEAGGSARYFTQLTRLVTSAEASPEI